MQCRVMNVPRMVKQAIDPDGFLGAWDHKVERFGPMRASFKDPHLLPCFKTMRMLAIVL